MATYCYAHGLVYFSCIPCMDGVAKMLRGDPPYRSDISTIEAYSWYFPQIGVPA